MKKIIFAAAVFLLILIFAAPLSAQVERKEQGNLVIEDIPDIPERIVERLIRYQNTRSAFVHDWDPAGVGMLISTRFGETTQFHYLEKPGGARKQLTFFTEPVGGGAVCPDPSSHRFLFTKDVGGEENYQIFYFDLDTGEYTMLTDGSSRNGSMVWSNRGDRFAYTSTKRNGRDQDIYVGSIKNPDKSRLILKEGGFWRAVDWSPDDSRLLVQKYVSINETYYHILDVVSGKLTQINPSNDKIAYGGAVWAKDGKGIYITSDEGGEFKRLKYYDPDKKTFKVLTADIPWDAESPEISQKGDRLAFTVNEGGLDKLNILDTASQNYKQIPGIPMGLIYGLKFHSDGNRLAMVINTPRSPGDIYVLDLRNNSLEQWTFSEVGGLNKDSFTAPELIHYETFDKTGGRPRMIPAFYYRPQKGDGLYPVIISIHGGPEGQFVPRFLPIVQYYLNELGIAVLVPNVRGSRGYGKSYLLLDNGYKREDSVKDIGRLLDWIEKQPELDASRIAVNGASYGGYMVLSSMTHYNDRLKCGVENVGISNFVTFLEDTKEYRRYLRRQEYGDERDDKMREFLMKISPTTNAHKITKPMFIGQGLNDPRVPVSESEQIVSVIRKNGGSVWYMLAKDEGHGFRKKRNRDFYTRAVILFLEENLLK